jgi:hypothetical protein
MENSGLPSPLSRMVNEPGIERLVFTEDGEVQRVKAGTKAVHVTAVASSGEFNYVLLPEPSRCPGELISVTLTGITGAGEVRVGTGRADADTATVGLYTDAGGDNLSAAADCLILYSTGIAWIPVYDLTT